MTSTADLGNEGHSQWLVERSSLSESTCRAPILRALSNIWQGPCRKNVDTGVARGWEGACLSQTEYTGYRIKGCAFLLRENLALDDASNVEATPPDEQRYGRPNDDLVRQIPASQ